MTGIILNGQKIPLPDGYTQDECNWTVSPNFLINGDGSGDIFQFRCYTDNNRVVHLSTDGPGYASQYSANYMIIGRKK